MIIELADEVFEAAGGGLALYQLFRLALDERHLLITQPIWTREDAHRLRAWLSSHSDSLRELLELILDNSLMAYGSGPSPRHRRVVRVRSLNEARWSDDPDSEWLADLDLESACRLAESPLRILVENRRNDGAFLRACMTQALRVQLEEAERRGWLEVEQGGGLSEVLHRVKEDGRRGQEHRGARLAVICDSDAKAEHDPVTHVTRFDDHSNSWGPSKDVRDVERACQRAKAPIYHHRLRRRAIENYLPGQVLQAWAGGKPQRLETLRAFMNLSVEQQHFFNMKGGLKGDGKSGLSPIYAELSPETAAALDTGFDGITEFFREREFRLQPGWMTKGQQEELVPVVENILGRI